MSQVRTTIAAALALAFVVPATALAAPTVSFDGGAPADGFIYTTGTTGNYAFTASDPTSCELTDPLGAVTTTPVCASPFSAAGLTEEGLYSLDVIASNGVDPDATATRTFWLDTSDPTAGFTSGPADNHLYSAVPANVTYGFTVTDPGTPTGAPPLTITCALSGPDPVGVASCTSPVVYTPASDGLYTFSLVATDGAGHIDTLSRSFTIDTTPPNFTSGPTLSPEYTLGFTNDTTPSFTWSTNETSTYTCVVDLVNVGVCASGFSTAALAQGPHTFRVVATDTAGHVTNSTVKSFTVDTTAPTFSFGVLSQHGASNYATNLTSTSMSVTPSETLDGSGASCDIGATCVPTFTIAGMSAGEQTLNVSGTDLAGNPGASQRKFFVDLADPDPPTIPTTPPVDTNDNTPTFGFSATDPAPSSAGGAYGNLTYQCRLVPAEGSFSACNSGTKTYGIQPDGNYTFQVRATDPSGRTGATSSYAFEIDTVPPTISNIDIAPNGNTVNYTNTLSPTFTFDSSESATFECRLDAGAWAACTGAGPGLSGSHSLTTTEAYPHTLSVRGTDPATNVTTPVASYVFGVDTTLPDPEATVPDGSDFELHDNPAITCTDPLGGGWASGVYTCVANIVGYGAQFSIPTHHPDLGYHEFTVTATDEAGNQDTTGAAHYVINAGEYDDAVNDFDPVGYWRLNNSQGAGTMGDSSGNANTGAYVNGIGLPRTGPAVDTATNAGAGAAEFGGKAYGYVNGVDAPQTAYTMDTWIKPSSTEAMSILSHGAGAGELFVNGAGRLAFRHVDTTIVDTTTTLTAGHWYHVQATWSRPQSHLPGTMTLRVQRIDGARVDTTGSSSRNASGRSTFYVGFGEQAGAQAFKGLMADAAYFDSALSNHEFDELSATMKWTFTDARPGPNFARPSVAIAHPLDGDGFQTSKAPASGAIDFSCADPLDDGNEAVACTALLDGVPVNDGDPLPAVAGSHTLTVTADDGAGDPVSKSVTFSIGTFSSVYNQDSPTAYWRLDEATGATTMTDLAGNHHGIFKWDPSDPLALVNGGAGISGDLNTTQEWLGKGAYGYVNGITAPATGSTVEAWVKLDNAARDQMILQHGGGSTLSVQGGQFAYRPNGNSDVKAVGGSASSTDYRQVVGTWDGVSARLYVDGDLKDTVAAPTPPPSGVSTFYLGRGDIGLPGLHGKLDEVAYFAKALSARRVLLHFLADPPPPAATAPARAAGPAFGDASQAARPGAKAKASAKVAAAKRALAKAKARLRALKQRGASRRAIAKAQRAVKARTRALAKARRAAARA